MGPSQADEADRWRSSRPLVDVRAAASGPARGGMISEQSSPGLADTESTVSWRLYLPGAIPVLREEESC